MHLYLYLSEFVLVCLSKFNMSSLISSPLFNINIINEIIKYVGMQINLGILQTFIFKTQ